MCLVYTNFYGAYSECIEIIAELKDGFLYGRKAVYDGSGT